MSLLNWIFDAYQYSQIDQAKSDVAAARAEIAAIRGGGGSLDTERLERILGELALAVKATQRLMIDKGLCTPDDLAALLRQVDLEDGRADGRSPV